MQRCRAVCIPGDVTGACTGQREAGRKPTWNRSFFVPCLLNTPRLVLIEWEDSHGFDGVWQPIDEGFEDTAMVCQSVGWLVVDGKHVKVVAPHLTGRGQGAGVMTIPVRTVLRIVVLEECRAPSL